MADTNLNFKKAEFKVNSQSEEILRLKRDNDELTSKLNEIQKSADTINNRMMMQKFGKDELGRKMAEAEDRMKSQDKEICELKQRLEDHLQTNMLSE